MILERCKRVLANTLLELDQADSLPIQLAPILERIGLSVTFSNERARKASSNALLLLEPEAHIVVFNATGITKPNVRFAVAHELAHFAIWKRLNYLPDKDDYWHHEALANDFAAKLLLPPRLIRSLATSWERLEPIFWPGRLANLGSVSWDASARAISEVQLARKQYFRFRYNRSKRAFMVESSTVAVAGGGYAGQKAVVRGGPLFETLLATEPGKCLEVSLEERIGQMKIQTGQLHVIRDGESIFSCVPSADVTVAPI